jgi:elongation factor 1-beta
MANVIIKLKVLPKLVETDFSKLTEDCTKLIEAFKGKVHKSEKEPIAFGMQALIIIFSMDEKIGATDKLEAQITDLEAVSSVDVADVRRAFG